MRVSVIIPTYNSAHLVVEAVASVLAQTRPADEIIVVDDGSTDDTPQRLSAFGPPVRYVRKENGGVSTARNRGVDEATGDWIAFLDADDVWHPRKLELQLEVLARRPDLALLGTGLYGWPGSHPDIGPGLTDPIEIPLEKLIVRNCLVTSTVIARAETLRSVGPFDLELRGPEDYDLWLRVAQRAPVATLRTTLTGYCSTTPGSLSKNHDRMEMGIKAILAKLEHAGVFRGRPLLRRRAWSYFRYSCGFMRYWYDDPKIAVGYLVRSIVGYPLPYPEAPSFARLKVLVMALLVSLRGRRKTMPESGV